jgi:ubiquinone/menaquinone biosynthesis C-methylase UbiE
MASQDKAFTGSIPEIYDRFLVPLIFEPYAVDLADRVAAAPPETLLEVACGTGAVTRALAKRCPSARITASDLNPPMIEHARGTLPSENNVEWREADALALPFSSESFDVVLCQFGVMFLPDKVQGYREARRVLKPGGRYLFNVWDSIETNEFADLVTRSLADVFPTNPPRFLARTPHGYCDADRIRDDLRDAGFTRVEMTTVEHRSRAASARYPAVAYCQGTPLRGEIAALDPTGLARATDVAAAALSARFGAGPVDGRIQAIVITAR